MSETIFKDTKGELNSLIDDIDIGDLALPDIQRPFIWKDAKVRKLLDSMYKGFPIGYFLFWESDRDNLKVKTIGNIEKTHYPKLLILDGQQRLTSLYSIIKNIPILDSDYKKRKIKISFNPLIEEFKVADASTEKNKEYIDDISLVFKEGLIDFSTKYLSELQQYTEIVQKRKNRIVEKIKNQKKLNSQDIEFIITRLKQINEPNEQISLLISKLNDYIIPDDNEKIILINILSQNISYDSKKIGERIQKLENLRRYPYQALEIKSLVDEEKVAEIFTRINSEGMTLTQSDFILTLISVFWEDGRREIEEFCKNSRVQNVELKHSPFNYIFKPDAGDIVRIITGVGFKRGRMKDAYQILKGRNLVLRSYSEELRNKQFDIFKVTQKIILDNTNWHNFLRIIIGMGFKSVDLVSSTASLMNAYILFIIGSIELNMDHRELEHTIGRWFFMSNLTSRYSFSPESQMEADLNKIKNCKTKQEFSETINEVINNTLTKDFWEITLPKDLLFTSSSNSPAGNTFFACLNKANSNILFSNKKVSDLYEPTLKLKKQPLEKHHIFPSNYLENMGFDQTMRNQIANKTFLEFQDNIDISDTSPKDYFIIIKEKYYYNKYEELKHNLIEHCIPEDFINLSYEDFLSQRRILMAKLIQKTFMEL